ncbi:MAG: serine/threonine protein kinase [Myxococcales bacterium]|nr:serine/threonine protein kinase [Myxococcales bacterium]
MPGEPLSNDDQDEGRATDRDAAERAQRGSSDPPRPSQTDTIDAPRAISGTLRSASASPAPSAPTSGPGAVVGGTLGRYEIMEEVGHGGMATVYRARDPRLERDVALKVIHRHLRENQEIATRFRHEARAVAKLKHPAIVEIYDVPDLEDGERYLVAEFVDGPSLRKYMTQLRADLGGEHAGLFPPEIAAALVLQILSALARAHEEGIIHRDVKPENILVAGLAEGRSSEPGRTPPRTKLTDFGIAKILDAQGMTSTGQILGSPAHMSPEQIEGGEVTAKVDVFAVGVLFYELVTGSLPFDGKNPAQVIRRVLEGQFTPVDRLVPQVGGRWAEIVASMLDHEEGHRPSLPECEEAIVDELAAMGIDDPEAELESFLRDPVGVARGWGARLKPILRERGLSARAAGDVVGGSHDLNRALAYDPSDVALLRAASSIAARERRARSLRRLLPFIAAGTVVMAGTFVGVRYAQKGPTPIASASTSGSAPLGPGVPGADDTAPLVASGSSSVPAVSVSSTAPKINVTGPVGAPDAGGKRIVRITSATWAFKITIDGTALDLMNPAMELGFGKHTVEIVGRNNCCELATQSFDLSAGEGPLLLEMKPKYRPATVNLREKHDGARLTVKDATGKVLAEGLPPLVIPMVESSRAAVVTASYSLESHPVTLAPGNISILDFK